MFERVGAGLFLMMLWPVASFAAAAQTIDAKRADSRAISIHSAADIDQTRQCLSDLKAADVEFRDLGDVTQEGCTVAGAVELDAVSTPFGKVMVAGKPTMSCLFARRFTSWVRDVGAPLTLAYVGSKLAAIETGAAFVCRTRNNKPGEKISEHAKGNAIDVGAFRLENGRVLSIKGASAGSEIDGVLMRALRTTACGYFTTVLGPGSDEAHKEHLHLDQGLHGPTDNYRICE
jgi:hypothetical protein